MRITSPLAGSLHSSLDVARFSQPEHLASGGSVSLVLFSLSVEPLCDSRALKEHPTFPSIQF
jgi:hypothetical protein